MFFSLGALPVRIRRLAEHFYRGAIVLSRKKTKAAIHTWWMEFIFLFLDLAFVPEFYESFMDFAKWHSRPLSESEIQLARSVFGQAIDLRRVRVDETARIACREWHVIYVSFYTINAWGHFHPDVLIHELVHVWQYHKMGSVYIPRAISAQKTSEGYNYGGVTALEDCVSSGGSLRDFNLEQQAEIVADYYCIRENRRPNWGNGSRKDLPVYEYFLREITG
jgi:hypothetical protein